MQLDEDETLENCRLKSRRTFYPFDQNQREEISKENFSEHDDKDKLCASLHDEVSDKSLRRVWSSLSGLWMVHGKLPPREQPFQERQFGLMPRSREAGGNVLARHDIAAICCKGCKGHDSSPGQDNFSCARLAGGFRLHTIADGHGQDGHWVSDRVVRLLPYFMSSRDCRQMLRSGEVEAALISSFERMQDDLISASMAEDVNLLLSGTTAVCILRQIHSPLVWVASVGDSRCIHICKDGTVSFSTKDHKPCNPSERARVLESGCEVTSCDADNGELLEKVVIKGERGRAPELGFTRSLGDLMYKKYGVIAKPEVFCLEKELKDGMGHFLLASDGIWEFMKNEDVAEIVHRRLQEGTPKELVVKQLAEEAQSKWKEEDDEYCDDISVILVPAFQKTAAPPAPDDSCFGGLIYLSEECRGRFDKLF